MGVLARHVGAYVRETYKVKGRAETRAVQRDSWGGIGNLLETAKEGEELRYPTARDMDEFRNVFANRYGEDQHEREVARLSLWLSRRYRQHVALIRRAVESCAWTPLPLQEKGSPARTTYEAAVNEWKSRLFRLSEGMPPITPDQAQS